MDHDMKMRPRGSAKNRRPVPKKPDNDLRKNGLIAVIIAAICIAVCVSAVFFLIRFLAAVLGIIFLFFGIYEFRNYRSQKDRWNQYRK